MSWYIPDPPSVCKCPPMLLQLKDFLSIGKNLILFHYVPTRISMYFESEGKITYVPLAASCITFWHTSHSSQFCIARTLAEGTSLMKGTVLALGYAASCWTLIRLSGTDLPPWAWPLSQFFFFLHCTICSFGLRFISFST